MSKNCVFFSWYPSDYRLWYSSDNLNSITRKTELNCKRIFIIHTTDRLRPKMEWLSSTEILLKQGEWLFDVLFHYSIKYQTKTWHWVTQDLPNMQCSQIWSLNAAAGTFRLFKNCVIEQSSQAAGVSNINVIHYKALAQQSSLTLVFQNCSWIHLLSTY